ncbi:MAG TPA: hypothetical protein VFC19_04700 [Candidatus Limnocylindrales bacterium]|nr:hypothetical protein [Candidatus Limnocylindrales bacterium]
MGGREGVYSRLAPPGEGSERYSNVIVPLDHNAPDFADQMSTAVKAAQLAHGSGWSLVQAALARVPSDQFRFAKETAAPPGYIRWSDGEKMFGQAKSILVAGAKSHVDKAPYFANRLGQYAKRFLDTALMGQTKVGSYIVTALIPTSETISLTSARVEGLEVRDAAGNARTGDVSESIAKSIEATVEALAHFHRRNSYTAFEESVGRGVSYEMLHSLAGLAEHSDGASVSVEFDPSPGRPLPSTTFEFRPTDARVLRTAGDRLLEDFPERTIAVIGRVHLLRRDAGAEPIIGVEWTSPRGRRRLRARLRDQADYETAVQAHLGGSSVEITGSLVRTGRQQYMLDNARLDEVIDIEAGSPDDLPEDFLF